MTQNKTKAGFWKRNRHLVYIVPWLVGFLCFQAGPMLFSLICGFTDSRLFHGVTQIGWMNYRAIVTDPEVLRATALTMGYACVMVPLKLGVALLVACLLNTGMRGIGVFRTIYYIPSILGGSVATAVLWKALFRENGVVNQLLGWFGLSGVAWLAEPKLAIWVLILLRVWEFGSPMLLLLVALRQIPSSLLEAARLDGAGAFRVFCSIKLPLIAPVLCYCWMIQFCAALQEFNAPYVMTGGGPRGATTLLSLLLYRSAFTAYNMGYASALAWVLFLLATVCTGCFLLVRRRVVRFAEEDVLS